MERLYQEEFVAIGFIRKGHGYKGHAKVIIHDGYEDVFYKAQFAFLEIDGYKVPFQIMEKKEDNDLIVKFEFIDSMEELKKYHKASLYLLKKNVPDLANSNTDSSSLSAELSGFTIHDSKLGNIGIIARIEEYPQQEMAIIKGSDDKEILIPLHPSLILEILPDEQLIKMDLPEGLV